MVVLFGRKRRRFGGFVGGSSVAFGTPEGSTRFGWVFKGFYEIKVESGGLVGL